MRAVLSAVLVLGLLVSVSLASVDSTHVEAEIAVKLASGSVDSCKTPLHKHDLDTAVARLNRELADIGEALSDKVIGVSSLIATAVGVFFAIFAAIMAFWSNESKKTTEKELAEARVANQTSQEILRNAEGNLAKERAVLREHITVGKAKIKRMYDSFTVDIQRKQRFMSELFRELGKQTGVQLDEDRMRQVFDRAFEKERDSHELGSYLQDLKSSDKLERIQSIWGIEALGTTANIEDLQNIVSNIDEDAEVRQQAQQSIENMKRRFGID